jgi:CRP/FNR family cyclic AMP-dependent transcriptional regulator
MISPELLRRFEFVAGLNHEQIVDIAKISSEVKIDPDTYFFHDGEPVDKFYIVMEGAVAILFEVPDREEGSAVSEQLTGELAMKEVVISTVGTGSPFGWAGIIPPNEAFASAKAIAPSKVIEIDCVELRKMFATDPDFAYHMTARAAHVMRERLRDLSIETLAFIA